MVERVVNECPMCQVAKDPGPPMPVIAEDITRFPWTTARADFQILPDDQELVKVINDYSKQLKIELVDRTSADELVPNLEKIMVAHYIIQETRTDKRPPFQGQETENS
ncbi:hypothetical protein NDU88_000773 [Pleurodeles waltl]|uniref:Uncharacterized protein n=1 Tax=Pleurodeles waltl TaxID=8319 RepID=A0AAV7V5Z8_PLEWA|nr:hypothetical protein NDU88_000773 [Pleurodeles waltl]